MPNLPNACRLSNMNGRGRQDKHKASEYGKKAMMVATTKAFGNVRDWQAEDLKSASSVVTMLKPKDLRELGTVVVRRMHKRVD